MSLDPGRDHADIQLPNELLSMILKELVSDPRNEQITQSTFASCRLASSVLCSLTTPLFFSFIDLKEPWNAWDHNIEAFVARAENLNKLLSIHHVAASVRTFALWCSPTTFENSTIAALISTILCRLPYITNFIFESMEELLPFPSTATDLSSAIQALCKSPNLTTLDLRSIESFPISAITTSPNLRYLRLMDVQLFFDVNPTNETSNLQNLSMDSLEVDEFSILSLASNISHNEPCAKYFSRIRSIQLEDLFDGFRNVAHCWDAILLFSETLTMLNLSTDNTAFPDFGTEPLGSTSFFDLGRLPALRHLKIQLPVFSKDNLRMLSLLNRLLSIPSSTSGIRILEIEIAWLGVDSEHALQDLFSPSAEWSTLDRILAGRTFVSLRTVVLGLHLYVGNRDYLRTSESRISTLSCVNLLFPKFRDSTSELRTLETHVKIS